MLKRIIFYPILLVYLLFSVIFIIYEENKYDLINHLDSKNNIYLPPDSDTVLLITIMLYISRAIAFILLVFTLFTLKRKEKIIIGFFLLVFLSCFSIWRLIILGGEDVSIHEDNINNKIAQIQEKIVDLTSIWDVFRSEIFKELYNNPETHLTDVIHLLSNKQVSDTQKIIAALSIQNLPLPKFLFFANKVLTLREGGKISEHIFYMAVFPPYDWNTQLHENYTDKAVKARVDKPMAMRTYKRWKDFLLVFFSVLSIWRLMILGNISTF